MTKIIDIGICIDNIDPKGIGRIRCVRYSDYVGEKEKANTYESWSDTDPFVANPFLPYNINFIPEIEQAIKLINYDNDKRNINVEYIAGPFINVHDFNSQNFTQQIENTTYGTFLRESPNIIDKNDNYINKKSESSFAKKTDYGIYGKSGSDIIFTKDGLQLRGGKLLSKEAASVSNREKMINYPIMGKKSSVLNLKKFPQKMVLETKEIPETILEVKNIKTLIEYEVDSVESPTKINFFVYDFKKSFGQITKTNFFNENTPKPISIIKLINSDGTDTTPTHVISINESNVNHIPNEIRDFLYTTHELGLYGIDRQYSKTDLHPIYFRPTQEFVNSNGDNELKNSILSKIKIFTVGPKSGLLYSLLSVNPPFRMQKIKNEILKVQQDSDEQTFASLKSDKIYFLSTDTNEPTQKRVNFNLLNKYEYTQEDYIKNIEPNTYSLVRGENLIRFLDALIKVLYQHEHNVIGPMVKNEQFTSYVELTKLKETIIEDLLNGSIRIN
jgi:hypothetical protein